MTCIYHLETAPLLHISLEPETPKKTGDIDAATISRQGGQTRYQILHLCPADATSVALLGFSAVKMQHLESCCIHCRCSIWQGRQMSQLMALQMQQLYMQSDTASDMFTDVTTHM